MTQEDVDGLRAGAGDEEIFDVVATATGRAFFTVWMVLALGMPLPVRRKSDSKRSSPSGSRSIAPAPSALSQA